MTKETAALDSKRNSLLTRLSPMKLVLASSSEPFVHFYSAGEVHWRSAAGGVITALDPVMRVYGGTWVATGLGNADRDVSDSEGKIKVPPGEESYTLKRVWLTKKEQDGFLERSSNSAIWPLSHVAYVRPRF